MAQTMMLPSLQQRYQGITVIVRGGEEGEEGRDEGLYNFMPIFLSSDELCEDVRMGGEYSVIGIPVHTLTESSTHTQVTTMVEVSSHPGTSAHPHHLSLLPFTSGQ